MSIKRTGIEAVAGSKMDWAFVTGCCTAGDYHLFEETLTSPRHASLRPDGSHNNVEHRTRHNSRGSDANGFASSLKGFLTRQAERCGHGYMNGN